MSKLSFPFDETPAIGDGSSVEVAPGVHWLRMPLPGSLAFINVWALQHLDGWTIVDTGFYNEQTIAGWEAAFANALSGATIARVICTHMHPDHCGLAGWFHARYGVEVWMSRLEYLSARVISAQATPPAPVATQTFYRATGWSEEQLKTYSDQFGSYSRLIHPLPERYRRLEDGAVLNIGGYDWEVVVGSGHSPEHVCLWSGEHNLLISGDQVLPKISSNVSVYPSEPDADPLKDWLNSIDRLKRRLPSDVLVLPAHNAPFYGLHERLDALAAEHGSALDRLEDALGEPRRVVDILSVLFRRAVHSGILTLATGEGLAHLQRLSHAGRATSTKDPDGVVWRSRTAV
jgi:glyoxylase-like metal-dependent hydrolase (beta-lactamase superfamily II)